MISLLTFIHFLIEYSFQVLEVLKEIQVEKEIEMKVDKKYRYTVIN